MSGAIEKIKAKVEGVLHKDKTQDDPTGPHSSHSANQADPRVDSDHTGTAGNHGTASHGTTGNTHSHGTTGGLSGNNNTYGSDPTGPHDSRLGNKTDPRVDSDQYGAAGNHGTGNHGTTSHGLTGNTHSHGAGGLSGNNNTYGSDPTGPHDSRLANKADPRVDSDRVGEYGSGPGGFNSLRETGNTHPHGTTGLGGSNTHGTTGLGGSNTHGTTGGLSGNNTYGSDPTGPHDSHLGNRADPRVDSDRVGGYGNTAGAGGHSSGLTGNTHSHGTTGSGLTGNEYSSGTTGSGLTGSNYGSDPTGPHDSRLGNKADPRVDSDTYGAHGNTAGGRSGAYGSDPTGPHDSHLGNRADPRIDSSTTGGYGNTQSTGGYGADSNTGYGAGSHNHGAGGLSSGPGPAENTAGPHKNDTLNKLDPRVDSDLNGSKTYGGNKTSGY